MDANGPFKIAKSSVHPNINQRYYVQARLEGAIRATRAAAAASQAAAAGREAEEAARANAAALRAAAAKKPTIQLKIDFSNFGSKMKTESESWDYVSALSV